MKRYNTSDFAPPWVKKPYFFSFRRFLAKNNADKRLRRRVSENRAKCFEASLNTIFTPSGPTRPDKLEP
ncbi:MAG: hypothetical protein V7746_19745 [Halioglobus sp.]